MTIINKNGISGFEGLTKDEYENMRSMFESNGISIRVTAYHGSENTYDVQFENPYQVYAKHYNHMNATQIHEKAQIDMQNY